MNFKEEHLKEEFKSRPEHLIKMTRDFVKLSRAFSIEPVVTRVLERIDGSSSVHEAGRAIDFRDEHVGLRLYTRDQVGIILTEINGKYRRKDGKPTLLHHSFAGGPYHFHLQLAPVLELYFDSPKKEKPLPSGYEPKVPSLLEHVKSPGPVLVDEPQPRPSFEDSQLHPAIVVLMCLATCLLIASLM